MNEIYALLLALEPNAAAHAAGLATLVDQTAAIEAYHRLESAVDQDISIISICNRFFHLSMVRPGNRDFTTQLIERLYTLSARYVVAYLQPKSRCIQAYKTHATLLDAFISRDQAGLSELLSDHIRITLEDLVHQVELSKRLRQTKRTSW
ncbi:FCD domain-containing protein [Sphingomonas sp. KR1UV-12]|uniref:FCD domain-containing protein n=1 Tax=Sphingomonas aurea TaxID=3063994 RepID=A0ABT9EJ91_9SPHN|nr:FCD domain-containing protein [Sphingomonas sp. KR1UV-12]MDP1027015.1 FCD domain-containing protein [Sphingomonas sp. KR1UV-12]